MLDERVREPLGLCIKPQILDNVSILNPPMEAASRKLSALDQTRLLVEWSLFCPLEGLCLLHPPGL
jgi:hypothetical protein